MFAGKMLNNSGSITQERSSKIPQTKTNIGLACRPVLLALPLCGSGRHSRTCRSRARSTPPGQWRRPRPSDSAACPGAARQWRWSPCARTGTSPLRHCADTGQITRHSRIPARHLQWAGYIIQSVILYWGMHDSACCWC